MGGTDDYYVDENGSLKRTKRGEGITSFTASNDHSQQISFDTDFNVETVSMTYTYLMKIEKKKPVLPKPP
jgi:hypothetical protein